MVSDTRQEAPSPCTGVCRLTVIRNAVTMEEQHLCAGCGRTPEEVYQWPRATPLEQWIILDKIKERRGERQRQR